MYVVQRRTGRRRHAQAPREGLLQLRRGALEAGAESLHLRQPTERACAQGFLHSASFRAQSCRGAGAQRPARGATHREADSCVRRTHSPTAPAPPPPRRLRVSPLSQAQLAAHLCCLCVGASLSANKRNARRAFISGTAERRDLQLTKLILFSARCLLSVCPCYLSPDTGTFFTLVTRSDEKNFTSEVDDDVRDGTCLFLPRKRILQGGSRDVPVLVPVRASPVPSVVRGSFVVKFFLA